MMPSVNDRSVRNIRTTTAAWVRLHTPGVRWELVPEFEPSLAQIIESTGEEVKSTPSKWVGRFALAGCVYYVKRSLYSERLLEPITYYLRRPRARQDWKVAQTLVRMGIPVVPHLAYGEAWAWRGLIRTELITAGPTGYIDLYRAGDLQSAGLQAALGQFLRKMHDAGVALRDLHAKNLLYSPEENDFCLLDLETVSIQAQVSRDKRVDHLARLHSRLPLSKAFYDGYGQDALGLAEEIVRKAPLLRRTRCLKRNNDFQPLVEGCLRWWVRTSFLNEDLKRILEEPEAFLANEAKILKSGHGATIGAKNGLVLKWYHSRKLFSLVKDVFRPSRARRAYLKAYHLELSGVPTARPVAIAKKPILGIINRSFFVMEAIDGAIPLRTWQGEKGQAIRDVAELVAKLHQAGFSHRDLKETNILFDRTGKPHLVDVDGLRYVGHVTERRAVADLRRLAKGALGLGHVSRADRARFLIHYNRCRGQRDWRHQWKSLEKLLLSRLQDRIKWTQRASRLFSWS